VANNYQPILKMMKNKLQINQKLNSDSSWWVEKKEEPCEVCSTQSHVLANSDMTAKYFPVFVAWWRTTTFIIQLKSYHLIFFSIPCSEYHPLMVMISGCRGHKN
jgi:hypothetical protein